MYTRHHEVPFFDHWQGTVEAHHFNQVQRALKRFGPSIRLELPGLRSLGLILQTDAWVIVDHAYQAIPVAAWLTFDALKRNALHAPIPCEVRLYHAHGAIILKRVLDLMEDLLTELLSESGATHRVIAFPVRE